MEQSHRSLAEASHISKRYGTTVALDDARIVIRPGRMHALVGRNGQWIAALNGAIILIALIVSRITSGKAQE